MPKDTLSTKLSQKFSLLEPPHLELLVTMENDLTPLLTETRNFMDANPLAATLLDAALNPAGQAQPTGLTMAALDVVGAATICYFFKFYALPWLAVGRAKTIQAAAKAIENIERSGQADPAMLERAVAGSRRLEKLLQPLEDPASQGVWNQLEEKVVQLGLPAAEDNPSQD